MCDLIHKTGSEWRIATPPTAGLDATTADWVVRCEATRFAVAANNHIALD